MTVKLPFGRTIREAGNASAISIKHAILNGTQWVLGVTFKFHREDEFYKRL